MKYELSRVSLFLGLVL